MKMFVEFFYDELLAQGGLNQQQPYQQKVHECRTLVDRCCDIKKNWEKGRDTMPKFERTAEDIKQIVKDENVRFFTLDVY